MTNDQLTIVKVGGGVIEQPSQLTRLLEQLREIPTRVILVHGGGRRATAIAQQLGITAQLINGRRVTDKAMLDIVTMVYGGLVNKSIVAQLNAMNLPAIGLTGADVHLITASRRPIVTVTNSDGSTQQVDFGFVGDVTEVNTMAIRQLLSLGMLPVIAPLTADSNGQILNTNADTIASAVAQALARDYATTLIFAFEKPGVLRDADDDSTLIPRITRHDYRSLLSQGIISGGMIPKIDNAFHAIAHGVREVHITSVEHLTQGTTIIEREEHC